MVRRRVLALLATAALTAVGAPDALAQSDDAENKGSLGTQVLRAADESLGGDAVVAVVRAYDRGYDLLQILEGVFDGRVAAGGTITDDEGAPVEPFRPPSGLIEGDGSATTGGFGPEPTSGEAIGIDVLERGIGKATKRIDKKVDLDARSERIGASEDSLFTMLAIFVLMADGYTPEQLIFDGFVAGGIRLVGPGVDFVILDEKGDEIPPAGVEPSPDQEEESGTIDTFIADALDVVGGVDPSTAAETPFKAQFDVKVQVAIGGDALTEINGTGRLGTPKQRSLKGFVVGTGKGELTTDAACSLSEGDTGPHPYQVSGPVQFGFSGPVDDDQVTLRVANVSADLQVTGDDSLCVGVVRDTLVLFETLSLGTVELELRRGARASAESTLEDATVITQVTLS